MTAALPSDVWTELAVREQNGLSVRLLWARATNDVAVEVVDASDGDSFELVLEPGEPPLNVFYHPYAYAAARGLERGGAREQDTSSELTAT